VINQRESYLKKPQIFIGTIFKARSNPVCGMSETKAQNIGGTRAKTESRRSTFYIVDSQLSGWILKHVDLTTQLTMAKIACKNDGALLCRNRISLHPASQSKDCQ
jgi:hypothetical protein